MPLLSVSDLKTHYKSRDGLLRAVDGIDLVVERGETVGLVGESGCGKSTLGKTVLRLVDPTAGRIEFNGEDITVLDQRSLQSVRKSIQMIFQDPYASLNPRQTIGEILEAPLIVHKVGDRTERRQIIANIVAKVGLPAESINRYPHEFSGGQRQRIGIARALLLNPELIVCDEPVSALDLSIQAQILNLLVEMKKEFGLSYLFISHDLSVVRYFADRVMVMYLGRIVESADNATLWSDPRHPYTRALMDAVPDPARPRQAAPLGGDLPSPSDIPSGCRFHTRCPLATDLCRADEPEFRAIAPGHQVACHFADSIN
ncbi:ABC transporter ATP-binding protein [Rhizobium leguminosarum]|uniref:ABC transporter ATP-binding protein n=1 Tax=Rhizobium leguminosarum TaxID=384 RepID=UPI001040E0A9|nr:oligopeptide/dipeptide ABC transporter ATP-binding protein [Rhizobium leguminosarum]MBY5385302.1 ATP-binding cassette domain-containing protein [Rhizobium leguminosarum]MBY5788133.1 ATP-binding cassette domain-containing protein [Rhizobium leguminosarum]MCA2435547.1 ATP-binding cassette domain-containing protein [Rhizobium leguminosarum]NEH73661.1 ATP-binding cassette domain-containing protein [Rhizobium leguminosarum]NEI93896.1 ATP-binding cassette domain-containing protein [Rhizobium legu